MRWEEEQERVVSRAAGGGEDGRMRKRFLVLGAAERSVRWELRSIRGV